jgi:hypothetical protein
VSNVYFSRFPTPEAVKVFGGSLQLIYSYTDPNTNSKKKVDILFNRESTAKGLFPNTLQTLSYEEKPNRVEITGGYNSFLTSEKHENVLQDEIFGNARCNKTGTKWAYVAKIKEDKTKSYFDSGTGITQQLIDIG